MTNRSYDLGISGNASDAIAVKMLENIEAARKDKSTYCLTFTFKRGSRVGEDFFDACDSLKPKSIFMVENQNALLDFGNGNYAEVFSTVSAGYNTDYKITAIGDSAWIRELKKKHKISIEGKVFLSWHYMTSNGIQHKDFEINPTYPSYDEYYPYIEGGIEKFIDDYIKSTSSILIFIGEPGTGKTSLLRHMIHSRKLRAQMTFEESILSRESFYIDYAANASHNLLIIEDADLILSPREDQNKLMARLLNISDGLVKLDRKKMIFTTNLANVGKIDPAMTRPGRCFDVVHFRPLSRSEAKLAAAKAGIERDFDGSEITLAELFNPKLKAVEKPQIGAFGFRRSA
jgi:hypothetical protein